MTDTWIHGFGSRLTAVTLG